MSTTAVPTQDFTLRAWDWALLFFLCGPTALMLCAEVGTHLEAMIGEAMVYFGLMTLIAYGLGRQRWSFAGKKPGAGRWVFRFAVVVLATCVFFAAGVKALGQSGAKAGTAHMVQSMTALRAALDSSESIDEVRSNFHRVAAEQVAAASSMSPIDEPFAMVGAEIAIDTLRPQLEMLQAMVTLGSSDVLASRTYSTPERRDAVLQRARNILGAGESVKSAIDSVESRARAKVERVPSSRSAREAFLHPLRPRPGQPPSLPGDPSYTRWANAVIALYEYLDATSATWTIDADGTLRVADGEGARVRALVAEVESSWEEVTGAASNSE